MQLTEEEDKILTHEPLVREGKCKYLAANKKNLPKNLGTSSSGPGWVTRHKWLVKQNKKEEPEVPLGCADVQESLRGHHSTPGSAAGVSAPAQLWVWLIL